MEPIYKKYFTTTALVWTCFFIVLFAVYLSLLAPQKNLISLRQKDLTEKITEYNSYNASDSDESRAELNQKLEQLNERLSCFVAEPNDLVNLKFNISRMADEIGVAAFSSRRTDTELYSLIPDCNHIGLAEIAIEFRSSFSKLAMFINALERHKPFIFVNEFAISQSGKADSEHPSSMLLSIFVRMPLEDESDEDSTNEP